jgi:hypothetical protein
VNKRGDRKKGRTERHETNVQINEAGKKGFKNEDRKDTY